MERPDGDGRCSDYDCPCGSPGEILPEGTGYPVISYDVVRFREDARSIEAGMDKVQRLQHQSMQNGMNLMFADGGGSSINPVLCCKRSPKLDGLNRRVIGFANVCEDRCMGGRVDLASHG